MSKKPTASLFDGTAAGELLDPLWKKEWQGMPEFVQEDTPPYARIIVRFQSEADLQEFAKLIGQRLTRKTKSLWHPQLVRGINANKRWKDEP